MALYYEIDINYHTRAKQDSKNDGKANDHYTTNDTNFGMAISPFSIPPKPVVDLIPNIHTYTFPNLSNALQPLFIFSRFISLRINHNAKIFRRKFP